MEIKLPQTLKDLSTITEDTYPWDNWSGAVNIIMVEDYIAFIKRSDEMPSHKGQMGFFGGHRAEGESPMETALRETEEESGIMHSKFDFLGHVEPVYTAKKRLIVPTITRFMGEAEEFLGTAKSNGEWSDLVLVPKQALKNFESWQYAQTCIGPGYQILFYPLEFTNYREHSENSNQQFLLWGASAKMIWNFFKIHS